MFFRRSHQERWSNIDTISSQWSFSPALVQAPIFTLPQILLSNRQSIQPELKPSTFFSFAKCPTAKEGLHKNHAMPSRPIMAASRARRLRLSAYVPSINSFSVFHSTCLWYPYSYLSPDKQPDPVARPRWFGATIQMSQVSSSPSAIERCIPVVFLLTGSSPAITQTTSAWKTPCASDLSQPKRGRSTIYDLATCSDPDYLDPNCLKYCSKAWWMYHRGVADGNKKRRQSTAAAKHRFATIRPSSSPAADLMDMGLASDSFSNLNGCFVKDVPHRNIVSS